MTSTIKYIMRGQLPTPPYQDVTWSVWNSPDTTGAFSQYGANYLINIFVDYTINGAVISGGNQTTPQIPVPSPSGPIIPQVTYVMKALFNQGQQINVVVTWKSVGSPDLTGALSGYPIANLSDIVIDYTINDGITSGPSAVPTYSQLVGPAGGDLANSYPNPTVVALQTHPISSNAPTINQILTWNGSAWIPTTGGGGTVIWSNDLSGTNASQTVVGLYNHAVASTAPISLAVPIYNTSLNHYDIRQITQDDIAAGFSITSFSGGSVVEIGATVSNPAFVASYSSTPISANITNTDNIDSPLNLVTPFTSGTVVGNFHHTLAATVTFTLTAVSTSTRTAAQTILFEPRSFGGVGSTGATSSVSASGNNAMLSTGDTINSVGLHSSDVGQTYGSFSPSNQKIYLLLVGGSHTFKDASTGFAFAFNAPTAVSFINQNGSTISMFLYESTNLLNATFSILVNT